VYRMSRDGWQRETKITTGQAGFSQLRQSLSFGVSGSSRLTSIAMLSRAVILGRDFEAIQEREGYDL